MSSCSAAVAVGEQRTRAARAGLPRPRRPSRPAPGSAGPPRLGTPRPGGGASAPGRAECNWWGAGGQATAATPRRQMCGRAGRAASARAPTGNRELVRRALSPPATRGRSSGALRRWSFRPTPSRLCNVSSFSSASPVPCLPTVIVID